MKKLCAVFSILLCIFVHAYAEELTTEDLIPEDMTTEEETQLITVKIKDTTNNLVSSIDSLKDKAKDIGFDKMRLKGQQKTELQENGIDTKVTITWDKAYLDDVEVNLSRPFSSILIVEGDIEQEMSFNAKGYMSDLIEAFLQLKNKTEESKEEEGKETVETYASSSPSASHTASPSEHANITPSGVSFNEVEEPFIFTTTEGCEILVDKAQAVAIVQERILTDGEETSPCGESLTRYPLTKIYSSCSILEDLENLKAYKQYTLGYDDPISGGRVEVEECQPDADMAVSIQETEDGCSVSITNTEAQIQTKFFYEIDGVETIVKDCKPSGESYTLINIVDDCSIRHDFVDGYSYQQKKQVYEREGLTVIVPNASCSDDTSEKYQHQTTRDTCNPTVNDDTVIFNNRKYITVNGDKTYISECSPDENSVVSIMEEQCDSPAYTHDFSTGQSYSNKNYYYMDGDIRVDVSSCITSEETFTHYYNSDVCSIVNDDTNKTSQIYAKAYITASNTPDSEDKIYISTCVAQDDPIAYTSIGGKWRIISQSTATLQTSGGYLTAYIPYRYNKGSESPSVEKYGWTNEVYWSGTEYWSCDSLNKFCSFRPIVSKPETAIRSNGEYCLRQDFTDSWVTTSGIIIDESNSDMKPEFDFTSSTKSNFQLATSSYYSNSALMAPSTYVNDSNNSEDETIAYECTAPVCTMTGLEKNPIYTRLDGSQYVDIGTVQSTKNVCGEGTKLNGVIQ
jgi:hypothetical protein